MKHKRTSRVLVIGCDHRLQRIGWAFEDGQREQYHEGTAEVICTDEKFIQDKITVVGEEIGYTQSGVAQNLCEAFVRPYFRIEMPLAERTRIGCPPDYEILFRINGSDDEVLRCHEKREQYMVQRVVEFTSDGDRGMVLCGRLHAERVALQLHQFFVDVECITLADYGWFDKQMYGW